MWSTLKRIKFLHGFYNLINNSKLRYQISLYKKFGLNKRFYSSISSKDLPEDSLADHPWLDVQDSLKVLPYNSSFLKLPKCQQKALLNWSDNGYALFQKFFPEETVEKINSVIQKLMKDNRLPVKDKRKFMHAVKISREINSLVNTAELTGLLNLIMGKEVDLFQSVNFLKGSEDPPHSDFIHMSTYPYGYLIAVWIALEDIDLENGPLFYYPGSHKLPYIMNKDFKRGGNSWLIEKDYKERYAEKIDNTLKQHNFEKKIFTASKGDVLVWHANLLHGGSPIIDPSLTRKSMVLHFYGKDVIRYHEITERPSLLESY